MKDRNPAAAAPIDPEHAVVARQPPFSSCDSPGVLVEGTGTKMYQAVAAGLRDKQPSSDPDDR
jgi:hypothetical protein